MQDMRTNLEKLRVQVAECEMIRDLATDPAKRDLFAKLAEHFEVLVGEIERAIKGQPAPDTFVGHNTHEPFPKEEE